MLHRRLIICTDHASISTVRKPTTIASSLYGIGMLGFVPSSPNKGTDPEWTSWETFFHEKLSKENPFSCSLELSNPGAIFSGEDDALPGLRDLTWAQSPKAGTSAIMLQPLGIAQPGGKGSLSITISWLKRALREDTLRRFVNGLEAVVRLLSEENEQVLGEEVTFGQLQTMLARSEGW